MSRCSHAGRLLLLVPFLSFGFLVAFSSGPPAGHSGAPGDSNCTVCHASFPLNSGPGGVQISAPDAIGSATQVPVTVTIINPQSARNGFQMSVQDSGANFQTGLQPTSADTQANGMFHINHTSSGNMQTSWTVTWNVPANLAAGPATFYAAGNATDNSGWLFGDEIYTTSRKIYRSGLSTPSTSWSVGQTHLLNLDIATQGPGLYYVAAAVDTTPTNLGGGLILPLNLADPFVGIAWSLPTIFQNMIGAFDANGLPLAQPQVAVPAIPSLAGITLNFAYATVDAGVTTITDVSNLLTVTLAP